MMPRRVLAVAAASGRVGYVFLVEGQLQDWGTSVKATTSVTDVAGFTQDRINELHPDILVTEKLGEACRKGPETRQLIRAIAETASHNELLDVTVPRPRAFQSKYEEAAHLANRYPDISGHLPGRKRRIFDHEPRGMIIFEALALAEAVIDGPPEALVAAMG
jgi:hypothetical protein